MYQVQIKEASCNVTVSGHVNEIRGLICNWRVGVFKGYKTGSCVDTKTQPNLCKIPVLSF